jgi:hypothetical protein
LKSLVTGNLCQKDFVSFEKRFLNWYVYLFKEWGVWVPTSVP